MADIILKKIEIHELPEAVKVYHTSRVDMQSRLGQNPGDISDKERAQALKDYIHIHSTGIFYGAYIKGQIIGISCAAIRDDIWFLSGFWVLPEFQNKGIGKPLLKMVYKEGVNLNCRIFCVWSSLDPSAQTCYLKMGMMPGYPVYRLAGSLKNIPKANPEYKLQNLDIETSIKIDSIIRGCMRKQDHEYWLGNGHKGFQVLYKNKPVSYFYCKDGSIGAGGWLTKKAGTPTTLLALKQASMDSETVTFIPGGLNHSSIKIAMSLGMKVSGGAHFLTSKQFGQLNQYLASGPFLY